MKKKLFIVLLAILIASFFIVCDKDSFFNLTITIEGGGSGTITADGSAITSGTAIKILKDKVVELIVTPASGSVFSGWTGADSGDVSGTGPYTITMDSDKVLIATFVKESSITLSVTPTELFEDPSNNGYIASPYLNTLYIEVNGSTFNSGIWMGQVTANNLPTDISIGNIMFIDSKMIRVDVSGQAVNHSNANDTTFTITINKDAITDAESNITTGPISINFNDDPACIFKVSILPKEAETAGCSITYSPNTYPFFNSNEVVTLTVNPATGWALSSWSGSGVYNLSKTGANTYAITMYYSDSLNAHFVKTIDSNGFAEDFEGTSAGDWSALTSGNDWTLSENSYRTSSPVLQGTVVRNGSQALRFGNTYSTGVSGLSEYESFFGLNLENITSPQALTFWYKKDTNVTSGAQSLNVCVDGETVININDNTTDWKQAQILLSAGNHTVLFYVLNYDWEYPTTNEKNVWIDDITLGAPTSHIGEVSYRGTPIANSTTPVNIGEVSNNIPIGFAVKNTGTAALNISSVALVGGASQITIDTFPTTIAPNETGNIIFKASPVGGPYTSGIVTINSNDPDTPAYQFAFSCSVVFFKEGFESTTLPTGWTAEIITGTTTWEAFHYDSHSGTSCARYYAMTDNDSARLYTPPIDCSSLTNPTLTFWMFNPNYGGSVNDELNVYYKVGSAGTWTLLQSFTTSNETFTQKSIALTDYNTTEYYISFESLSHNMDVRIDDIEITD